MSEATFSVKVHTDDGTVKNCIKNSLTVGSSLTQQHMNIEEKDLNDTAEIFTNDCSKLVGENLNSINSFKTNEDAVGSNFKDLRIDRLQSDMGRRIDEEVLNMCNGKMDIRQLLPSDQLNEFSEAENLNGHSPAVVSCSSIYPSRVDIDKNDIPEMEKLTWTKLSDKCGNLTYMPLDEERVIRSTVDGAISVEVSGESAESQRILNDSIDGDRQSQQDKILNDVTTHHDSANCDVEDKTVKTNSGDTENEVKNYSIVILEDQMDKEKMLHKSDVSIVRSNHDIIVNVESYSCLNRVSTGAVGTNLSDISVPNSQAQMRYGDSQSVLHGNVEKSVAGSSTETPSTVGSNVDEVQIIKNNEQLSPAVSDHQTFLTEHHKSSKSKSKAPPDNMLPVGRVLHDLGLDLVRQEVYRDLIDIQAAKDSDHRLDDKDKGQLLKLTEAHTKLKVRNHHYVLHRIRCPRCKYVSTTRNVLELHREHGHCSRAGVHTCCVCDSFRTRYTSQFISHMETVHSMNGRLAKKSSTIVCPYCPYEHKSSVKVEEHTMKCVKKFQLGANLQPLPSDCDIPIRVKQPVSSWNRPSGTGQFYEVNSPPGPHTLNNPMLIGTSNVGGGHQHGGSRGGSGVPVMQQPSVMEIGGQLYSWGNHNGKPLLTSLRSQIGNNGAAVASSNNRNFNIAVPTTAALFQTPVVNVSAHQMFAQQEQQTSRSRTNLAPPTSATHRREPCEICGAIMDGRQSLWMHLQSAHKVQLSRSSMNEQEPIACEMCKARFWTYQGLARHSLLLHKRNSGGGGGVAAGRTGSVANTQQRAFRCHLCGVTQTTNPLNHLSTHHNVTLLDMYHGRQCCMCNRKLRTGRLFEDHMIQDHRDIFANIDVLHTVLQALSTALCLKSEDTRPGAGSQASQHQREQQLSLQQHQQQIIMMAAVSAAAEMKAGSQCAAVGVNRSALADVRLRSPPGFSSTASHSSQKMKQPHARGKEETAHSMSSSTTSSSSTIVAGNTPDKKTTEEETQAFSKLYEEYADIGRPISRAMKHKILLASTPPGGSTTSGVVLDLTCPNKVKDTGADSSSRTGGTPPSKRCRTDNGDNGKCTSDSDVNNGVVLCEETVVPVETQSLPFRSAIDDVA